MSDICEAAAGDTVAFGPCEWLVLEREGDRALLIAGDAVLKGTRYHGSMESVTWETSDLRVFLNGDFLDGFSSDERTRILESVQTDHGNPKFENTGGSDTTDRVFCLSAKQAKDLMTEGQRKASCNWWLRTPGYVSLHAACVFGDMGGVYLDGYLVNHDSFGVRPALWVSC